MKKGNDVSITKMLADFGITSVGSEQIARQCLFDRGVFEKSVYRKYIARNKVYNARIVLQDSLLWHCHNGDCRGDAKLEYRDYKPLLLVEREFCMVCGGSNDRRALYELVETMEMVGIRNILVVGGAQTKRDEVMSKFLGEPPEWRFVDGKKGDPARLLKNTREWAEIIVLWLPFLDHRVSTHFDVIGDPRVVKVRSGGIAALAKVVSQHLSNSREAALAP